MYGSDAELELGAPTIDRAVEQVAVRSPGAVAVGSPSGRLTYAELIAATGAIASRVHDIVPAGTVDPIAAVTLDRSTLFVPAVLGCWRAGVAYLPADLELPASRLSFMLDDAGVSVVITDRVGASVLGGDGRPILLIEDVLAAEPAASLPTSLATPEGLAYVIYTSGSTGAPKGVAVEHRQLANYVTAVSRALDLEPGMRWAVVSSFSTDLAHTALYPPLVSGGSAHIVPYDLTLDALGLAHYFEAAGIDCLKITPTHLEALLVGPVRPLPTRRLVCGGEALSWELVERIRATCEPSCATFNHYGPTETTVGACVYRCEMNDVSHDGAVPIGRALDGVETIVVDESGAAVGSGEIGELQVAGAGVARGYMNRDELTAQQFVRRSDAAGASRRVYRTGDLVRMLPDGNLQFRGRQDGQTKLRGHRVELGEIEAALAGHPAVDRAVAVVPQVGRKRAVLTAWIVGWDEPSASAEELGAFLRASLPEYMVPVAFLQTGALPLLPSGKVDRRALESRAEELLRRPASTT